jgi:hypothetical protein
VPLFIRGPGVSSGSYPCVVHSGEQTTRARSG